MIILGHPTGNPNSHQAALAYWEADLLQAFVTAWFPTLGQLDFLNKISGLKSYAARLRRRRFEPLANARIVDQPSREVFRLGARIFGFQTSERIAIRTNGWLMRTLSRLLQENEVTGVYTYEDCALGPFQEAKKRGVRCLYDLPIGYGPVWHRLRGELSERYPDWENPTRLDRGDGASLEQKQAEMELADLVIVPSEFARSTIDRTHQKKVVVIPFGTEMEENRVERTLKEREPMRFLFAGTISIRKGVPTLLAAWEKGRFGQRGCELWLAGAWKLRPEKQKDLPDGVSYLGVLSGEKLKEIYRQCHILTFPSFFEGFGLVITEALSFGLPVITTFQTCGESIVQKEGGRVIAAGDEQALGEAMSFYEENRSHWRSFSDSARACAVRQTWPNYRRALTSAMSAGEKSH